MKPKISKSIVFGTSNIQFCQYVKSVNINLNYFDREEKKLKEIKTTLLDSPNEVLINNK